MLQSLATCRLGEPWFVVHLPGSSFSPKRSHMRGDGDGVTKMAACCEPNQKCLVRTYVRHIADGVNSGKHMIPRCGARLMVGPRPPQARWHDG